jgi:hypothetical protein
MRDAGKILARMTSDAVAREQLTQFPAVLEVELSHACHYQSPGRS